MDSRNRGYLIFGRAGLLLAALLWCVAIVPGAVADSNQDDEAIARSLAAMLRAGRTVISNSQARINDPAIGDKGLSGKEMLPQALKIYEQTTGTDPMKIDPSSRQGRLLHAQMDAIIEVMDANQSTINQPGVGFKGFIPAVFARLVNEAFARRAQGEAEIKVTAPQYLVRNRKSRPDAWENNIIVTHLLAPDWPKGQAYSAAIDTNGRPALRMMLPEYYSPSCLTCHGAVKGELDITGYPKEGAKEGDLGGVISIVIYH